MNPIIALWCSASIATMLWMFFKVMADLAEEIGANDDSPYR